MWTDNKDRRGWALSLEEGLRQLKLRLERRRTKTAVLVWSERGRDPSDLHCGVGLISLINSDYEKL